MLDLTSLAQALRIAKFDRIAVQVGDDDLSAGPDMVKELQSHLPESVVSLLGDSVTECCLDEIAAEHYGADCIVKLGHSCWFACQRLAAFFVPRGDLSKESLFESYKSIKTEYPEGRVLLFIDSMEDAELILQMDSSLLSGVYICMSPSLSFPGSHKAQVNWFTCRPYTSRAIHSISSIFQQHRADFPLVAGRFVFRRNHDGLFTQVMDIHEIQAVLHDSSTTFLTGRKDSLHKRLVLRFATRSQRVVCAEDISISPTNYKELLRRYRGVESVKDSTVIGIVVTHCAASGELFKVRDLLAAFLRALGKEVHMFSVTKADGVKLGNFPEIDCFVVMACPETDYFESHDLAAACVSPFEALVAVESLDWSDHVITDYDEMLARMVLEPPPRTPRTPRAVTAEIPISGRADGEPAVVEKLAPAMIEVGLRGIPSRYVSEPARAQ